MDLTDFDIGDEEIGLKINEVNLRVIKNNLDARQARTGVVSK